MDGHLATRGVPVALVTPRVYSVDLSFAPVRTFAVRIEGRLAAILAGRAPTAAELDRDAARDGGRP